MPNERGGVMCSKFGKLQDEEAVAASDHRPVSPVKVPSGHLPDGRHILTYKTTCSPRFKCFIKEI